MRSGSSISSLTPTLPIHFVRALPEVARELGIDFQRLLQDVGVEPALFENPGERISYRDVEHLFLACESRSGCEHVGLLLGERTRLRDLGLAARAALCEATTGDGLRSLVEHFNLHDTPATTRLVDDGTTARFSYAVNDHGMLDTRHFEFDGMTVARNMLRDLCGVDWKPTIVRFACPRPSSLDRFNALFGVPLAFDAEECAIEFESHWLQRPLPAVPQHVRSAIAAEVEQQRTRALADLPGTLRRVLRKRLLIEDFSMDDVASQLSMHRRTLDRRLQRWNTTYGEILEAVRDEIAHQLLRDTQLSVHRVAQSVRFSSAANFATSFRRRFGMTPTEFRRQTA